LLLRVHPETPQTRFVEQVAQVLQNDGLVVYPTTSGYALGCLASSHKGRDRLYKLKGKDKAKVMALLFHDFSHIAQYARVSNFAFRTMKHVVPGPYTFILPSLNKTAKLLDTKRPEVGVRMPSHPFLTALLPLLDGPMLNTAARFTSDADEEHLTGEAIHDHFKHLVDLVVDAGEIIPVGTTILSLVTESVELVRKGQGPLDPLGLEEEN
jgi:tRNA threonylcarbamoyl adenosine modification protein (Sua5/YciO/YrdC/YwlC family)